MDKEEQRKLIDEQENEFSSSARFHGDTKGNSWSAPIRNWVTIFALVYGVITTALLSKMSISGPTQTSVPYCEYYV